MNCFIDTETTGLPPKGSDWKVDYNDFPYILSLCISCDGVITEHFINNPKAVISEEITALNGIDQKTINEKGISFEDAFKAIVETCLNSEKIIGHNIYFDTSIIKANVLRYFGPESEEANLIEEALHKDKRIDTVRLAQKKLKCKWLKLIELHEKLFGCGFENHNAINDVMAVEKCYNELMK